MTPGAHLLQMACHALPMRNGARNRPMAGPTANVGLSMPDLTPREDYEPSMPWDG